MTDPETLVLIQQMKAHLDEMIGIGVASSAELQLYTKIIEWQKNHSPAPGIAQNK